MIPNIGQIDPFSLPMKIFTLYEHKCYSNPQELYSLTTHFHCKCGWKFPCIFMAWRLLFDLWEYMCMTNPLNIPYMDNPKAKADQLTWREVQAGQLTWCEGEGWAWHTILISIYGRKCTLGRSRLITWPSLPVCPIHLSLV